MKNWQSLLLGLVTGLVLAVFAFGLYRWLGGKFGGELSSPLVWNGFSATEVLPLEKYEIKNLANFPLVKSDLKITKEIADEEKYTAYLFSYQASGGSISGQLNIPKNYEEPKVILMVRGYVPLEIFATGMGTKNAAAVFASQGFITVAPDFLGFGESSPDLADSWESRFIKPVQVKELLDNLTRTDFKQLVCDFAVEVACSGDGLQPKLGLWGHSNGGQIALTVLEGWGENLPTSLWAPVTAPFPYSILFFTDEMADEGLATRKWLSLFEQKYDVLRFSLTKNLELLTGDLVIHHGTSDEAALVSWSLEFEDRVEAENKRRAIANKERVLREATMAATLEESIVSDLPLTKIKLYLYEGADHNLQPRWNEVVSRDLEFYQTSLR